MKTPSEREIENAYHRCRNKRVNESALVEFAQWSRFDPRLAEALLVFLSHRWRDLNPIVIRENNILTHTPAVMGVLLDQCESCLIDKIEKKLFSDWKRVVLNGVSPAFGEMFLIGLHPLGGLSRLDEILFASKTYRRWGFGGKDVFINKFAEKQKKIQRSLLDVETRKKILARLMKSKKRITVKDYVSSCESRISRRIAQKDLSECPKLSPKGNTRARFYVVL